MRVTNCPKKCSHITGADANKASWGYRQLYMPIHLTIYGTSPEYGTNTSKQAPISDRIEIIRSLHEYGADLNWGGDGDYSWTPLYTATHPETSGIIVGFRMSNEILRLGADPHTSYYPISPILFIQLACEEAANKYNSDTGYKAPKYLNMHNITADYLQSFRFQYSQEIQKLKVININLDGKIENRTCYYEEVKNGHTELFDLSEVAYAGELSLQDLLNF
jgi:hypothetical protein